MQIRSVVKEEITAHDGSVKKEFKKLRSEMRKGFNTVISGFDEEYGDLRNQVEGIKRHIELKAS